MSSTVSTKEELLGELSRLEVYFSDNNYNPKNRQATCNMNNSLTSTSKLLFCAPHALNHYRNNALKIADVFTGSLCQLLANNTGQSWLVSTSPDNKLEYLGFGQDYICQIENAVENGLMIVDVHGMSDQHNFDICIGTGPNPSIRTINFANKLVSELSDYKISINYPFNATAEHTITNFVQTKLSGDSIQIEIASRLRCADNNLNGCSVFLDDIVNFFVDQFRLS